MRIERNMQVHLEDTQNIFKNVNFVTSGISLLCGTIHILSNVLCGLIKGKENVKCFAYGIQFSTHFFFQNSQKTQHAFEPIYDLLDVKGHMSALVFKWYQN